jgi:hypothetical protein
LLPFSCSGENDLDVVALVGKKKNTSQELQRSFELDPQYVNHTPLHRARRNQLDYRVQEEHFYKSTQYVHLIEERDRWPEIEYL